MAKGGIKINLKGFEKMLEDLQAAGGNVERAAAETIRESARVVEAELRAETKADDIPDDIPAEIQAKTSSSGDRYEAEVGWELGTYHPADPSAGYKAIFLNYGTVRRTTKAGKNRGEIPKRKREQQFIYTAKKKAQPKVRKLQNEMLKKALEDLR